MKKMKCLKWNHIDRCTHDPGPRVEAVFGCECGFDWMIEALVNGETRTIVNLLERRIEVEGPGWINEPVGQTGLTPIMIAALTKNKKAIRQLIWAGADPELATPCGMTAEDYFGGEFSLIDVMDLDLTDFVAVDADAERETAEQDVDDADPAWLAWAMRESVS